MPIFPGQADLTSGRNVVVVRLQDVGVGVGVSVGRSWFQRRRGLASKKVRNGLISEADYDLFTYRVPGFHQEKACLSTGAHTLKLCGEI